MCECIEENEIAIARQFSGNAGIRSTWGEHRKVVIRVKVYTSKMNKIGNIVDKEKKVSITSSFCPFCGEKYPER